jgi:hypothetical protein
MGWIRCQINGAKNLTKTNLNQSFQKSFQLAGLSFLPTFYQPLYQHDGN